MATNHALLGGVAKSAAAIASTARSSLCETAGMGKREVPSKPDAPWIAGACTAGRTRPVLAPA